MFVGLPVRKANGELVESKFYDKTTSLKFSLVLLRKRLNIIDYGNSLIARGTCNRFFVPETIAQLLLNRPADFKLFFPSLIFLGCTRCYIKRFCLNTKEHFPFPFRAVALRHGGYSYIEHNKNCSRYNYTILCKYYQVFLFKYW